MAWFRVRLSEEEQRIVERERREHPHEPTRRKLETLWGAYKGGRRAFVEDHWSSGVFLGRCGARSVDSRASCFAVRQTQS